MPTFEGIRLKALKVPRQCKVFTNYRKKKLHSSNFTIISNNCWGGMIYESYDIQKLSPTVGLFFMASDYIKFLYDLKGYIEGNLHFISPNQSRWKDAPEISGDSRLGSYPIGVLSNGKEEVEIFFLHAHSENEAKDKWCRRCKRINWDKLLIKFNDQNGCTIDDIIAFLELPFEHKLFFTCKKWEKDIGWKQQMGKGYCTIKQFPKYNSIMASYEPFGKSRVLNVTDVLNQL